MKVDEYKFSKYNHIVFKDDDMYAYNALTGGFCKFDKKVKSILENIDLRNNKDINILNKLPEEIIDGLKKGGFIIGKNIDEFSLIKSKHLLSRYSGNNLLGLTILPTLSCNFRCPYCFEADKGYNNIFMSDDVMKAILEFIDSKLDYKGTLHITWFGGEPLLGIDIITKFQKEVLKIVDKKKLFFSSAIITNGYLLSKEVSDKLLSLKINFAQITLDGAKQTHDNLRILTNGNPTFDKIINNILSANDNLKISVRVNVTKDNIHSMNELIDYLAEIGFSKLKNTSIYFAIVRDYSAVNGIISNNCFSIKDFAREQVELSKLAHQKGLNSNFSINPNISVCGSLSPNSFVFEPNGDIQKCWTTVGDKQSCIGNILSNKKPSYVNENNISEWYSWTGFDNEVCKQCDILPLCMGGCPLNTLNNNIAKNRSNYKCIEYKYNLKGVLEDIIFKYNYRKDV